MNRVINDSDQVVEDMPGGYLQAHRSTLPVADNLRVVVSRAAAEKGQVGDARRVLLGVLAAHPKVKAEPAPQILLKALSASSVDLVMRFWVSEANIATSPVITMQVTETAKETLQQNGMDIPFPHLHIDGAKRFKAPAARPLPRARAAGRSGVAG